MRTVLLVIALSLTAWAADAHHSSAMFDKGRVTEVTATVKEFQWTNPHVWIEITVKGEGGDEQWSIEGLGTNTLFRMGWRPNSFAAGQEILIRFNPMRDGSNAGGFIGAKFEDGTTIGRWE